jgi:hypothetical protein
VAGLALRELAVADYVDELVPSWLGFVDMLTTNRRLGRLLSRTHFGRKHRGSRDARAAALVNLLHEPFPLRTRLVLLSALTRPDTFAIIIALAKSQSLYFLVTTPAKRLSKTAPTTHRQRAVGQLYTQQRSPQVLVALS